MFKKIKEQPLNYWEEKSYMMAIPRSEFADLVESSFNRISKSKDFKIKSKNFNVQKNYYDLVIEYDGEDYQIGFYEGDISVPEYYLNSGYYFSKKDQEDILKAKKALTVFMGFKDNYRKSYQLQLKLITAMINDLVAVLDESAEKILPEKWVKMTAQSKVLPNPKSLFTVQAVSGKNNEVWLHTHGLSRCGITELEILESDADNYQNHYNLISTYAMYLLDKKNDNFDIESGAYIGCLINGEPVVVTGRSWPIGIKEYKHLKLGNLKDRKNGHNTKSSILFLYQTEEDEKNKKLRKVSIYDKLWGDNPIFFISDEETSRMKALAIEEFDYVKEHFKDKDNHILLKIGLPLEERGKFEHIWFELLEFKGDKFKAKLTQEPYDVDDIHTGDERWYSKEDITDWIIYTKKFSVNPDNVYLLESDFEK